ncbi:MAG TPA: hypothetical protein VFA74_10170 [Terriglobales bacterium]|nr:hypothetical protein [Terriglobales bacterium]
MAESNTPSSSMPAIPPEANVHGTVRSHPPVNTLSSQVSIANTHSPTMIQRWMHRINVLLFVFLCAVIGVLLVILPWRTEWMDNHLLSTYPILRMIVGNAFTRGICSGLGVLDIWIGFWEAIHYHED